MYNRHIMRLFLFVFFLLYGSLHAYVFLKARSAFGFGIYAGTALALFFVLMIFAPVIVRVSENAGYEEFARLTAWVGYTWLGVVFLFFSASIVVDLYRLLVYLAGAVAHRDLSSFEISAGTAFWLPLLSAVAISVYGYNEALNIRTEHIVIGTPKLPTGIERIRIAQISDVHIGLIVRRERLGLILQKVKDANPDILISTGDLVDGQINGISSLSAMLDEIRPKLGKYAITGNHEYFAGIEQAIAFTRSAGFTVLRGQGLNVGDVLTIAGIDDPAGRYSPGYRAVDERDLLSANPGNRFTVLLKHRPLIDESAVGFFDLQLSGHVHKGQIFPFSLLTKIYYPKDAGMLFLKSGMMYVSRGSGTWGPPIRFLAPPEVTVIDIIRRNAPEVSHSDA